MYQHKTIFRKNPMKIFGYASFVLGLILSVSQTVTSQSKPSPKTDKGKKDSSADGSSSSSAASAFWVAPRNTACPAPNGKAIIFVLNVAAESKTQPYFASLGQDELPTFYAGEQLSVEVIATEAIAKEVPLLNISVDTQKADPLNVAPVRPSSSPTSAAAGSKPQYYCLTWPQKLIGDTIPKITLTGIYKAATPDPADLEPTILLAVASFPQVHTRYHYNVATGVVVSSLRNPSFSRVLSAAAANGNPAQYKTVKDNGNVYAAPALFFTAYLLGPMDAESEWKFNWENLKPQPTLGFSLSSPADNFFFGAASELRRNVQIVYGYHLGKVTKLSPILVDDPTSNAVPATVQRFKGGGYVGLTFNIDFIKGLFTGK
jgi:hypothetical protein